MILTAIDETPTGELHFISIEFTDQDGNLLPYVEQRVTVQTEGCTLLGLGSALCKTDERYDSDTFTSYRGRLLAVVQGHGSMTVTSQNVLPVSLEV